MKPLVLALLIVSLFINCGDNNQQTKLTNKRIYDSLKSDSIFKVKIENDIIRRMDSIKKSEEKDQIFTSENSELLFFNRINYCSDFPYYTTGNTINEDTKIYVKEKKGIAKLEIENNEIKCWLKDDINTSQMNFLIIKNEDLNKTNYHFFFEDSSRNVLWGVLLFGNYLIRPTGATFRFANLLYKPIQTEDGRVYFKKRINLSYFNNR